MDRERLPEQISALDELVDICDRENVSLVLVAGDVFDTYLPSAPAEEAFYRAAKRLAGGKRAVVIVSGNHDDGVRLTAAAELAEEHGIYIFGNQPRKFSCEGKRPVRAVQSGEGYVVIENEEGERVYVNALPYPNEARFKEEKSEESDFDKFSRWIARGEAGYQADMPHILISHLFVAGGRTSESERSIDLGGARAVPLRCLPDYGYVALGHLHKRQKLGENVYYSGSLLQYSFDEAGGEKGVYLLTTDARKVVDVQFIKLNAGKPLVRLQANGVASALELLPQYEDCYIELTLYLTEPLATSDTQALRTANEGLVSLIPHIQSKAGTQEVIRRSRLTGEELFTQFHLARFGEQPDEQLKRAFLSLFTEEQA